MVVFTCQHCGESLKKSTVEKHYLTKCRFNKPHLTCVDCLKDFIGDEFNAHTQCVSEAERYSAKGTVIKPCAGRNKQARYIEIIQNLLNSQNYTPGQRRLLVLCSKYDNVPRKQVKFINFMTNIARSVNPSEKDLISVFEILENAWKNELQAANNESGKTPEKIVKSPNKVSPSNTKESGISHEVNSDNSVNDNSQSKKIKKEKKHKDIDQSSSNIKDNGMLHEVNDDNSVNDNSQSKKTKKEKHKGIDQSPSNIKESGMLHEVNDDNSVNDSSQSKKTKKEKHKGIYQSPSNIKESGMLHEVNDDNSVNDNSQSKKTKKGKKHEGIEQSPSNIKENGMLHEVNNDNSVNDNFQSKKTRKEKHKGIDQSKSLIGEDLFFENDNCKIESEDVISNQSFKKIKKYGKLIAEKDSLNNTEVSEDKVPEENNDQRKIKNKSKRSKTDISSDFPKLYPEDVEKDSVNHVEVQSVEKIVNKNKKRNRDGLAEQDNLDSTGVNEDIGHKENYNLIKSKKKSKKSKTELIATDSPTLTFQDVEMDSVNPADVQSGETVFKKSKKRNMQDAICDTTDKKKKGILTEEEAAFDWTEVIVRVLRSRKDKELSLERLAKKTINEYQTVKPEHRTPEQLLAKFNKKVKKAVEICVFENKAKLIIE